MTENGEMRQLLGELLAGQRATDAKLDANNDEARSRWDRIDVNFDAVRRDQQSLEKRAQSLGASQRRFSERLTPLEVMPAKIDSVDRRVAAVEVVNERVHAMEERIGAMEKLATKLAIYGGLSAGVASIVGAVLLRYGASIWHWIMGRP